MTILDEWHEELEEELWSLFIEKYWVSKRSQFPVS